MNEFEIWARVALIDDLADESDMRDGEQSNEFKKIKTPYAMQHIDKFEQMEGKRLKQIFDKNNKQKHEETQEEDFSDFFNMQFTVTPETMSSSEWQECDRPDKLQYIEQMFKSPEYEYSRQYTMLDSIASDIACEVTSEQYSILVKKNKENPKNASHNNKMAAKSAVKTIGKEVEEYVETMNAIGIGKESGSNPGLDPKRIKELYMQSRKNHTLKRILNLAGRFRMMARSLQKMKVSRGLDDLIGVTNGNDIPRLLPIELGSLASDNIGLRAIAMSKFVESNMLEFSHQGYEPAAKGPIVVCVDESGSMHGPRIESAKAFCLAMGLIAQMQKRWIAFVSFSSDEQDESKLCFPPNQWNQEELVKWLCHFYNRGTDCRVPLQKLPFEYWKEWESKGLQKGQTDIIYVSDGEIDVPENVEKKFNAWKEEQEVKVHTIIISSSSQGFDKVSDFIYNVDTIDIQNTDVQQVMSI